ncbi:hypothetical protein RAJCM14343_4853 [Rhodococcus aetherivorans]|uniref:Uncharacterized protein n=1 Tax=Rhodococcus aetherivorans TaxID=191292 RepID=A0ABQ0YSJ9_9NOCA|nr:hypothetical protein RAJCM14343_4853 [Rhodococcus aetherivorans]CCW14507.1 hypothetical protein EBESD8_50760 [Rhodococcus aetherivorans]
MRLGAAATRCGVLAHLIAFGLHGRRVGGSSFGFQHARGG